MNLEQKVESLESEFGVMKGEIKQTLVDLREFVMKQGGPFVVGGALGEGGVGITQEDIERMLEEAQARARTEAGAQMREDLEAIRLTSQREIEALRAEQSAQSSTSQRQLEALQAQQSTQSSMSQRQLEELRVQQSSQSSTSQRQLEELRTRQAAQPESNLQQPAPRAQVVQAPTPTSQVVQAPAPTSQVVQAPPSKVWAAQTPPAVGQTQRPLSQVIQVPSEATAPAAAPPPPIQAPQEPAQAPQVPQAPAQTAQLQQPMEVPRTVTETPPYVAASPTGWEPGVESPAPVEELPATTTLDANLLTSLMRWVGDVKRRLGANQLEGFLDIYKLTGHMPPVVEKLIYTLASMQALPDESSDQVFTMDDLVDALLQLHAIVYGPGYMARGSLLDLEEQSSGGAEDDG